MLFIRKISCGQGSDKGIEESDRQEIRGENHLPVIKWLSAWRFEKLRKLQKIMGWVLLLPGICYNLVILFNHIDGNREGPVGKKVLNRLIIVIGTIVLLHANIAVGKTLDSSLSTKRSSYGNSSSSKSSGSSSKKSYSNSARSGKASSENPGKSSKYGNSSGSNESESKNNSSSGKYGNTAGKSAQAPGPSTGSSPFGHSSDKGLAKENAKEALTRYNADRSKFKASESVGSGSSAGYGNSSVLSRTAYNPDTYVERRGTFYRSSGYSPPVYIYRSYPRFGMWDAMFMWFMLDNITKPHYAQMYHNHQNDPGFRQWREEAEKLSGENQELKQKLGTLDQEVAKLKGQPVDPTYSPPGVDTDLLMDKRALDEGQSRKGFSVWKLLLGALLLAAVAYIVMKLLRAKGKTPPQKFKLD